jgi:GNAT superfamily N-acetyltransferase
MSQQPEPALRDATPDDVGLLVEHRRLMIEEIRRLQNRVLNEEQLALFGQVYGDYLREALDDGRAWGWVVEAEGKPVASGVVSVLVYPPMYSGLHGPRGLLYGLYTHPGFRRRGLARCIVQAAVDSCRGREMTAVLLHPSDAGRPLYESLGFEPTNEMRYKLAEGMAPSAPETGKEATR